VIKSAMLISCVLCEQSGTHDRVTVFSRGGNAGTLCVDIGDGIALAKLLIAEHGEESVDAAGRFTITRNGDSDCGCEVCENSRRAAS